jgi:hypothetical protein
MTPKLVKLMITKRKLLSKLNLLLVSFFIDVGMFVLVHLSLFTCISCLR